MSAAGEGASAVAMRVKEELEWSAAGECGANEAAAADLYAGHEVKSELVLGPEQLQPQGIVFNLREPSNTDNRCPVKREPSPELPAPRCSTSGAGAARSVGLGRPRAGDKPHACAVCRDTFLTTHSCVHTEEETSSHLTKQSSDACEQKKTYSCDMCGKCVQSRNSLVRHIRNHTGRKLHSCNIGRKQFATTSCVARHKLIHIGEKSCTCNVCKKIFRHKNSLVPHESIHTEKRFTCVVCNDIMSRALISANIPCVLEPPGLCRTDGKRPDGLTLVPWQKGKCLLWDATCVSSFAASHLSRMVRTAGAAADFATVEKQEKYSALGQNYYFVPLAFEATGCWGSEAIAFIREVGRRIRERGSDARAGSCLVQRLSIAIQRGNAASVMVTFAPGTTRGGLFD